jgi:hypothetical protein
MKVREAFDATPYPGNERLVVDQSGNDPEGTAIASAFRGKEWEDVSVEMLRSHADALPLFTPAAFRYYLPAYMIGAIDHFYDLGVALDGVLFNLRPPEERSGWEWDFFCARSQQFEETEREAIRSFLELMHRYELADWGSEGIEPPRDRVGPALDFWAARLRP